MKWCVYDSYCFMIVVVKTNWWLSDSNLIFLLLEKILKCHKESTSTNLAVSSLGSPLGKADVIEESCRKWFHSFFNGDFSNIYIYFILRKIILRKIQKQWVGWIEGQVSMLCMVVIFSLWGCYEYWLRWSM